MILSGTSYKTVIVTFNPEGKELFKTYLSTTDTVAVQISNDNKYLAIAEVDTTGTVIQSNIKIISIEKAQTEPSNSIIYTYKAEPNSMIVNIKYQSKYYAKYTNTTLFLERIYFHLRALNAHKRL